MVGQQAATVGNVGFTYIAGWTISCRDKWDCKLPVRMSSLCKTDAFQDVTGEKRKCQFKDRLFIHSEYWKQAGWYFNNPPMWMCWTVVRYLLPGQSRHHHGAECLIASLSSSHGPLIPHSIGMHPLSVFTLQDQGLSLATVFAMLWYVYSSHTVL